MRKLTTCLVAFGLAMTAQAQDFTRTMSPTEVEAAGLNKLAPSELAKLKEIVERYKAGEVAVVQQAAEQRVAIAEAKAKDAETKSAAASAPKKGPGWLGALTMLSRIADKPEAAEAMTTRIAGKFDGWTGRTKFTLENGQVWQQNDDGSYIGAEVDSPAVRIFPGRLNTFWMEVEGVNPRVKVKPIKLE